VVGVVEVPTPAVEGAKLLPDLNLGSTFRPGQGDDVDVAEEGEAVAVPFYV